MKGKIAWVLIIYLMVVVLLPTSCTSTVEKVVTEQGVEEEVEIIGDVEEEPETEPNTTPLLEESDLNSDMIAGSPIIIPGHANILGSEEIVFDWTTDRCEDSDIPDTPARAFRDADGNVQLVATHHINRRMIGPTLDLVEHDCSILMESDTDSDPSSYNNHEWISSVYTLDGQTIYALVHNEFQGHRYRELCPDGDWQTCWWNAITLAKSFDKGLTYVHAPAPTHLIASVPYRYEPGIGPSGIFHPTQVVHNPKDGYYYVVLQFEEHGLQKQGLSVMRTQNLDDPQSWRAWDGEDFTVRFINPYLEQNYNPSDHIVQRVAYESIDRTIGGLSFNSYFNKLTVRTDRIWKGFGLVTYIMPTAPCKALKGA